jgi:hypothetical protein
MVLNTTASQKYVLQKVTQMPPTRVRCPSNSSRFMQLRSQLEGLEIGDIGKIWCPTRPEANSIRADIYKLIKEFGWAKDPSGNTQRTAILPEAGGWALYIERFG